MPRRRKRDEDPSIDGAAATGTPRRQRGRLVQRQGDPGAPRLDPAVGRRAARPAHRPRTAAGVDLGHGAWLRRRPAATFRRPRAVPAVDGVRRADRLLLHPAARDRLRTARRHRPAGHRAVRRVARDRSTSSPPSTSGSPRSASATPTRPTTCSPRSSAPRTGPRNWHEHFRTWRKKRLARDERGVRRPARRGRGVPRGVRRTGSRRSDRRATCSRWRTRHDGAIVLVARPGRGVAMRGSVIKKGDRYYVKIELDPTR